MSAITIHRPSGVRKAELEKEIGELDLVKKVCVAAAIITTSATFCCYPDSGDARQWSASAILSLASTLCFDRIKKVAEEDLLNLHKD